MSSNKRPRANGGGGRGGGRGRGRGGGRRGGRYSGGGKRRKKEKKVRKGGAKATLPDPSGAAVEAKRFVWDADGIPRRVARCSKHKWALQFGYCGTGYKGLQIQDHVMTIERELATALFRAGAILDTNLDKLNRIGWSRAARTDKGVHAASNLIVARIMVEEGEENKRVFLERVNRHLPDEMTVFSAHRVTKSFDARWRCERRFYEYLMPTFMFAKLRGADMSGGGGPQFQRRHQRRGRGGGRGARGKGSSSAPLPSLSRFSSASSRDSSTVPVIKSTGHAGVITASAAEADAVTVCLRGLRESWARRQHWCDQQKGSDAAAQASPSSKSSASTPPALQAAAGANSSSSSSSSSSVIATTIHRADGMQTGARLTIGRKEGYYRRLHYVQSSAVERAFGRAELNFGPGRWASVLMSQDVASHRMNAATLAFVNSTLKRFVGTHSFHNFTAGHKAGEATCQRYMIEFTCSEPFMLRGVEFVALRVLGQSFMLHQIRKMVCLVLMLAQKGIRDEQGIDAIFRACFSPEKHNIPPVPPDGLFLDRLYFDSYNKNVGAVGGGVREELSLYTPEINARLDQFKNRKIRDHIAQKVVLQRPFQQWRNEISYHGYNADLPGEREWRRRQAAEAAGIGTRKREDESVAGSSSSSGGGGGGGGGGGSVGVGEKVDEATAGVPVPVEPPLKIAKVVAKNL
jgi:tRNA pseudouridine38-40 synthase